MHHMTQNAHRMLYDLQKWLPKPRFWDILGIPKTMCLISKYLFFHVFAYYPGGYAFSGNEIVKKGVFWCALLGPFLVYFWDPNEDQKKHIFFTFSTLYGWVCLNFPTLIFTYAHLTRIFM